MVSVDVNFFAGPIDRDAPLVSFGVFTGVFLPLVYLFWTRYVCNVAPPDPVFRKINTHSLHLGQPHQGAPVHPLGPAGPVHAGQHARVCLSSLSLSLSLSLSCPLAMCCLPTCSAFHHLLSPLLFLSFRPFPFYPFPLSSFIKQMIQITPLFLMIAASTQPMPSPSTSPTAPTPLTTRPHATCSTGSALAFGPYASR